MANARQREAQGGAPGKVFALQNAKRKDGAVPRENQEEIRLRVRLNVGKVKLVAFVQQIKQLVLKKMQIHNTTSNIKKDAQPELYIRKTHGTRLLPHNCLSFRYGA